MIFDLIKWTQFQWVLSHLCGQQTEYKFGSKSVTNRQTNGQTNLSIEKLKRTGL